MRRTIEDISHPEPRARKRGPVKQYLLRAAMVAALMGAIGLAACSGDGKSSPPGTAGPGSGTPMVPSTQVSGTAEPLPPELQKILDRVAEVRGLEAPPTLKASLVSRADLPALLDRLITEDDRQWFAETTTLYRLLGHFTPEQDYLSIYQSFGALAVLGLYSPADEELWVVHDGPEVDFAALPRQQMETLVHELVHVLQDYHFGLQEVYDRVSTSLDWEQAWTSVVEGDAVTHERKYSQKYLSAPVRIGAGRAFLVADIAQLGEVPASIARELLFPYTTGADWIRTIVEEQGSGVVDEMIKDPPRGTVYVLHPELLRQGWKPRDVKLPDLAPALGGAWSRESGGSIGEFGWRNYFQLRIRAGDAAAAAAGWAGDRYDVYVDGGESAAAFRVSFKDAAEARQFAQAQKDFLAGARAELQQDGRIQYATMRTGYVTATTEVMGDEVVFVIASSRAVAEKAMKALLNG
jgi:hypothetical protein